MPFYLTNENIEATIERNPDDIFNPSGINHQPSYRNTKIRQLISQEIQQTFEKYIQKLVVINGLFCNEDSLKEDICLTYLFRFETDNDEYEIIYHVPSSLISIFEKMDFMNDTIFLSLSKSLVTCLNMQDFAFLEDIKLVDLSIQTIDDKKIKTLKNLYSLNISIDNKEYLFYLQLDNQFNKIF